MQKPPNEPLSVVVVGASGDLARKKTFPALFALYSQGLLPEDFNIFGFARSAMDDRQFRERISGTLTCRYVPGEKCSEKMEAFLNRCHYVQGQYDSSEAFRKLQREMRGVETADDVNHLFYMAIPPSVFTDVAHALADAGMIRCGACRPWSRIVIEKPFGRDRASSDQMVAEMAEVFSEAQTFRIDHYLGKEVIQNLMVLRFANLIFEPIWNNRYIKHVKICWKEDLSVEGRAGYFDHYGIIRDVIQNHLLQVLSLTAMEPCTKMDAGHVANQKVRVLRSIAPLTLDDVVVGQYTAAEYKGRHYRGYLEEDGVPADSVTPTYGAVALNIDNDRWRGTPFFISAGKGLNSRETEIIVQFREVERPISSILGDHQAPNALIIRVQPNESIVLTVANKVPGMGFKIARTALDLRYHEAFDELIPDAYESLILDVIRGDKSLFIRKDELAAAWDIFTPVLHQLESEHIKPESYSFGSCGPAGARELAARCGIALEQNAAE